MDMSNRCVHTTNQGGRDSKIKKEQKIRVIIETQIAMGKERVGQFHQIQCFFYILSLFGDIELLYSSSPYVR